MKRLSSLYKSLLWLVLLTLPFSFLFAQQIWQPTNSETDYPIYQFLSHDDHLYAAFYGAGIFKTADEGNTWTACHQGLTNFLARDLVVLDNTLFVGTNKGGIFKSLDGGDTWQASNGGGLNQNIWSLLAVNNRLFAGTSKGMYFTDDAGNTWQKVTLPRPIAHHQIIFSLGVNGNQIIAGSNNAIYLSEDLGETWQQIKVPTSFDIMTISVQNDLWLLGTSGEGIISSQDGINWSFWNKESGNTRSLILVEEDLVLGSAVQGVMSIGNTINDGTTINNLSEGFASPSIRSVGYHQGKLYAGTYKQGIWRYDVPQGNFAPPITTTRNTRKAVHLYPNPVESGLVTLEYNLAENTTTYIHLFDAFGKNIAQIAPPTEQYQGFHRVQYNMDDLMDGTYYFHIQLGDQLITKSIVLIKP